MDYKFHIKNNEVIKLQKHVAFNRLKINFKAIQHSIRIKSSASSANIRQFTLNKEK